MKKNKSRYSILPKEFGFRVVNNDGDAELGNWHIADFNWKEDAELFVKMKEIIDEQHERDRA